MKNKLRNNLRVSEAGGLCLVTLEVLSKPPLNEHAAIVPLIEELINLEKLLQQVNKQDKIISNLKDLDKECDDSIKAINYYLKGFALLKNSEYYEHANVLLKVFKRYGTQMAYQNTNSQIADESSFMKHLQDEELMEHINALPEFSSFMEQLKISVEKFLIGKSEYTSSIAERKQLPKANDVKMQIVRFFNGSMYHCLAYYENTEPELFKIPAECIQQSVNEINENIKQRSKRTKENSTKGSTKG